MSKHTTTFAPLIIVFYALFATLISLVFVLVVPQMPVWAGLILGCLLFIIMIYIHDFWGRSQAQETLTLNVQKLQKNHNYITEQLKELKRLRPNVNLEEILRLSPERLIQFVESEVRFLKELFSEMETYESMKGGGKEKIHSQAAIHEKESLGIDTVKLVESLKSALKSDRIEMYMQPIVKLPQRKPQFFECFSRIREEDGSILIPDNYLHLAKDESLISIIDNTVIYRSVQMMRRAEKRNLMTKFFCNLSLESLCHRKFFEGLIDFIKANPSLKKYIIFEFESLDLKENLEQAKTHLEHLHNLGCQFSLDQIQELGQVNIPNLARCGFKYLKIDVSVLLAIQSQDPNANDPDQSFLKQLKRLSAKHGVEVIMTKIEEEIDLLELLEFNFDYGQGYLFGKPQKSPY